LIESHELLHLAVPANEQMCGYAQVGDLAEIRVGGRVEAVLEKGFDLVSPEPPRRQTDVVHDQEVDGCGVRALVAIWRRRMPNTR
jgi:hypothetical protein